MKTIKITKKELDYLKSSDILTENIQAKLIKKRPQVNNQYEIKISEDLADEIRDKCGGNLQTSGFDMDGEPNEEGKILESLIDKFFIGNDYICR